MNLLSNADQCSYNVATFFLWKNNFTFIVEYMYNKKANTNTIQQRGRGDQR